MPAGPTAANPAAAACNGRSIDGTDRRTDGHRNVTYTRLNTYGRRAFSVVGPMACVELTPGFYPGSKASSTDCIRRLLKAFLFARYEWSK